MQPLIMSVDDAAIALSIGKTKLYSLIGKGEIPAHKLGKRTLLKKTDIENYIENLESYPTENAGV